MDAVPDIKEHEARVKQIEQDMIADGVPIEERVQTDYFAFEETHVVDLPDGVSWIEHKELNEGGRTRYLNATNRDVRLQKVSGDAIIKMAPGDERRALLESAICGWNLTRGGKPLPFTKPALKDFLEKAPPKIIDLVEKAVRLANPWLLAEASVEEIDKEIETLKELRERKLEEEAGKAA